MQDTLLYTYWDVNGDGINLTYLSTYSDKLIFDTYNRSIYAQNSVLGNHFIGSYHGEVFNDFVNNTAYGRYSSAHGSHTIAGHNNEASFGTYNASNSDTLFSVGYGTSNTDRKNALEIKNNGVTYFKNSVYAGDMNVHSYVHSLASKFETAYSYLASAYSYSLSYSNSLGTRYDNAYTYLASAYSYGLTYTQNVGSILDNAYTYLANAYSYVLTYSNNIANKFDNAYTYLASAYSYSLSYSNSLGTRYDNAYTYLANAYSYGLTYTQNVGSILDNAYTYLANAYTFVKNNYPRIIASPFTNMYMWVGTVTDLPAEANRYKNVIYVVVNEVSTLPEYNG